MSVKYTTTYVCDRCGKQERMQMKTVTFKNWFIIPVEYDLCSNCMKSFEKWLKNEVEQCQDT